VEPEDLVRQYLRDERGYSDDTVHYSPGSITTVRLLMPEQSYDDDAASSLRGPGSTEVVSSGRSPRVATGKSRADSRSRSRSRCPSIPRLPWSICHLRPLPWSICRLRPVLHQRGVMPTSSSFRKHRKQVFVASRMCRTMLYLAPVLMRFRTTNLLSLVVALGLPPTSVFWAGCLAAY
jgi:hypothetical protein